MLSTILLLSAIASVGVVAVMRASGLYDCRSWIGFGLLLWVCIVLVWVFIIMWASIL